MTKKVYYAVGGTILLTVSSALFFLYKSVETTTISTDYETTALTKELGSEKDFGWLKGLSEAKSLSYSLPVEELHIEFALSDLPKPKKILQITAKMVDSYQFFCIKQIFEQNSVNYSILKKEDNLVANLANVQDGKLAKLQESLKYYEIDYKLKTFYKKDY